MLLEDLHWADKPTALLLTHLVRSIGGHIVRPIVPTQSVGWRAGSSNRARIREELRLCISAGVY